MLPEEFPDLRLMLATLPEVTTRVTLSKQLLLRALEERCAERVALRVAEHGTDVLVVVTSSPSCRFRPP